MLTMSETLKVNVGFEEVATKGASPSAGTVRARGLGPSSGVRLTELTEEDKLRWRARLRASLSVSLVGGGGLQ